MNQEGFTKLLDFHKVEGNLRKYLMGEEIENPDEFDFEKELENHAQGREEFIVEKRSAGIVDEWWANNQESKYLDTINPKRNAFIKAFEIPKSDTTDDEGKAIPIDKLFEIGLGIWQNKVTESINKTGADYAAELTEYKNKLVEASNENLELRGSIDKIREESEAKAENTIYQYKVGSMMAADISDDIEGFVLESKGVKNMMVAALNEMNASAVIKTRPSGEVYLGVQKNDGTPLLTPGGNDKFDTFKQLMAYVSKRDKFAKVSNGGQGGNGGGNGGGGNYQPSANTRVIEGKNLDRTSANFLKKKLGL